MRHFTQAFRSPLAALVRAFVLLLPLQATPSPAQPVIAFREQLERERPEAWAMRWFAGALLPSGVGAAEGAPAGRIELGLEVGSLPHLTAEQQTVGFAGTKREELNRSPVAARLAATLALPGDASVTLGWVPPVEAEGVAADLVSLRLARPLLDRGRFRLSAALLAQRGGLEGDITCDAATVAAGADPVRNPYRCEARSSDELRLELWGGELAAAYRLAGAPRWQLHAAAAAFRLEAEMRVDARYNGLRDRSVLAFEGWQWVYSAGASVAAAERLRLGGEVAYSPLEVIRDPLGRGPARDDSLVHLRLRLVWRWR